MHSFPHLNVTTLDSATYMKANCTALIVTLNTTSFILLASPTSQLKPTFLQNSADQGIVRVCKPNFRSPIYANYMSPQINVSFAAATHTLYSTIDVRTQEAFDFGALLGLIFHQLYTSVAVPVAGRYAML